MEEEEEKEEKVLVNLSILKTFFSLSFNRQIPPPIFGCKFLNSQKFLADLRAKLFVSFLRECHKTDYYFFE